MLEQPSDVPACDIREAAIAAFVIEERNAVLPEALVVVHPGAVLTEDRLGHERGGLATVPRDVLDDVLELHQVVAGLQQGAEAVADLLLSGGADLVVVALDADTGLGQLQTHLGAHVGEVVERRDREVATLVTGLVTLVAALLDAPAVPGRLDRVDVVVRGVLLGLETHIIEDVELGLGAEVCGVGAVSYTHLTLPTKRLVYN